MNTNSISSANGRNVQLLPRLANLFRSGRDASQAKAPEVRNSDYRAQDHVAYHTDGTYSHGKPIGGETQFGIEGRVPTPAFGMTRVAIGIYMLNARVAAFAGETLDAVRAQGGRVFDARYAQLKAEFEGRIAAARRLIEPLESQAEAVRLEANGLPAVIRSEGDKFCLPQDWRLLALVGLLVLWGFVTYSEWINAAARQLYLVQDWGKAKAATAPWMAVGVVLELILISAVGIAGGFWRQVWRITSVTSIFIYAGFYAFRYGASPDAGVASTIAAAMNGTTVTETGKFLDQGLYFGQLLFGLVCGATLLEGALHLMVGRDVLVSNPDRERLQADAATLTEQINQEDAPLRKAQGHLAEYEASRESFIDFGVRAFLAVQVEREVLDHERQLLDREHELLERKRKALLDNP